LKGAGWQDNECRPSRSKGDKSKRWAVDQRRLKNLFSTSAAAPPVSRFPFLCGTGGSLPGTLFFSAGALVSAGALGSTTAREASAASTFKLSLENDALSAEPRVLSISISL